MTDDREEIIEHLLAALENRYSERDRQIIEWLHGRTGEPRQTLVSIARRLGISNSRVWQLKERAFRFIVRELMLKKVE